jgi:hypothetical protein
MLYPLSYEGGEVLRIPGWAYRGVPGRPWGYTQVQWVELVGRATPEHTPIRRFKVESGFGPVCPWVYECVVSHTSQHRACTTRSSDSGFACCAASKTTFNATPFSTPEACA